MDDGGGNAITTETADGEIIAVVDQTANGVGNGGYFIGQSAVFGGEKGARGVRRRIGEKFAFTLGEKVHERNQAERKRYLTSRERKRPESIPVACAPGWSVALPILIFPHQQPESRIMANRIEIVIFAHVAKIAITQF